MSQLKERIINTPLHQWYVDQKNNLRRSLKLDAKNQRRIPFIEEVIPKKGIGAELGVLKGHFSPILLKHSQATELHLVDPWYFLSGRWEWTGGDKSTVTALIRILKAFKKEIEDGKVKVHVGDDLQVLSTFPDQYFDWVYIDSSHEYEHTQQELKIIRNKIKPNGVIAGDDWVPDPSHRHHGVYKAVSEFMESENYQVIYSNEGNLQWAIKKNAGT